MKNKSRLTLGILFIVLGIINRLLLFIDIQGHSGFSNYLLGQMLLFIFVGISLSVFSLYLKKREQQNEEKV